MKHYWVFFTLFLTTLGIAEERPRPYVDLSIVTNQRLPYITYVNGSPKLNYTNSWIVNQDFYFPTNTSGVYTFWTTTNLVNYHFQFDFHINYAENTNVFLCCTNSALWHEKNQKVEHFRVERNPSQPWFFLGVDGKLTRRITTLRTVHEGFPITNTYLVRPPVYFWSLSTTNKSSF